MGFKDFLNKLASKRKQSSLALNKALEEDRIEKIVEERKKSSNEREYERFLEEKRQEMIKEELKMMRKERQDDINFNHNPLDAPNITKETEFNVLREKNQFANQRNMFVGQPNIHKDDKNIFKNNGNVLKNNNNLFKNGRFI